MQSESPILAQLTFQKATLLLAEKRTAMTTLRTGIAISLFPLSILSFIVTMTDKLGLHSKSIPLILTLAGNIALIGLGLYLIRRGFVRLRFHERKLAELKAEFPELKKLFYPG